jgi:hypothetical protein
MSTRSASKGAETCMRGQDPAADRIAHPVAAVAARRRRDRRWDTSPTSPRLVYDDVIGDFSV